MDDLSALPKSFTRLILLSVIMFVAVVLLYAEPFSLTMDPISWLGRLKTDGGSSNFKAFLLFAATLLFNAFKWRQIFSALLQLPVGKESVFKTTPLPFFAQSTFSLTQP